jgi:hypothetical protein
MYNLRRNENMVLFVKLRKSLKIVYQVLTLIWQELRIVFSV